ncbi:hypothetical protein HZS_755 [Henneguya salminicola]|nr:hypothetical protein HZS_755 [Henneguya salminicola]
MGNSINDLQILHRIIERIILSNINALPYIFKTVKILNSFDYFQNNIHIGVMVRTMIFSDILNPSVLNVLIRSNLFIEKADQFTNIKFGTNWDHKCKIMRNFGGIIHNSEDLVLYFSNNKIDSKMNFIARLVNLKYNITDIHEFSFYRKKKIKTFIFPKKSRRESAYILTISMKNETIYKQTFYLFSSHSSQLDNIGEYFEILDHCYEEEIAVAKLSDNKCKIMNWSYSSRNNYIKALIP